MAGVNQTTIAKMLNLSQRTVSLVITGSDKVAPETRERVLKLAAELGYRPNRSAMAMRSGRFNTFALIQSTNVCYSYLPLSLMASLQEELIQRDMHLMLAGLPDDRLSDETFLPSVLREWSVDGFIIGYHLHLPQRMVDIIERQRYPAVWLNSQQPHSCVFPDELDAGRRLTEHLLRLGHRRIAFFSLRRSNHYSEHDRRAGYEQAMKAAGLSPQILHSNDPGALCYDETLAYLRAMLQRPDRPTAVLGYESAEAFRVLLVAGQLGIRIPEELSIATFHERLASEVGFPITTLVIPGKEMGEMAVRVVLERLEDPKAMPKPQAVRYTKLCEGRSCAKPE